MQKRAAEVGWPWLRRLAVVLQVVAYVGLLLGVIGGVLSVATGNANQEAGLRWADFGRFLGILVSTALGFVLLMGLSEAARILLRLDGRAE